MVALTPSVPAQSTHRPGLGALNPSCCSQPAPATRGPHCWDGHGYGVEGKCLFLRAMPASELEMTVTWKVQFLNLT